MTNDKWLKTWLDNYHGKSEQSKELESFLKKNYKGHAYVPWATMIRLMLMQDPTSSIEVVKNNDGAPLHFSSYVVHTQDGDVIRSLTSISSFVIVRATFLGQTFEEVYPIQDNAYNAPKVVDQNMVNKAIQRAKAKIVSLATGIGFRLYEDGDLQFDSEDSVKSKIENANTLETTKQKAENPTKLSPTTNPADGNKERVAHTYPKELHTLIDYIIDTANVDIALERLNGTLQKKFGFTISQADGVDVLTEKLKVLTNPTTTLSALKKIMETV